MPNRDYPAPEHIMGPDRTPPHPQVPPPTFPGQMGPGPIQVPYYLPPYYPLPTLFDKPPMAEVDRLLPTVPFMQRPRAYKAAIWFLVSGIVIIMIFLYFTLPFAYFSPIGTIIISLFIIIALLGFLGIFFLIIPKKIGWYFSFLASVLGLAGLPFGTPIAMLAIVSLMWPSTRYYFHTGRYPAQTPYAPLPTHHRAPPAQPEQYLQQYPSPLPHPYPQYDRARGTWTGTRTKQKTKERVYR